MKSSESEVRESLKRVLYPGSRRDVVSLGLVGKIEVSEDGAVSVELRAGAAKEEVARHLRGRIEDTVSALPGVGSVAVRVTSPGAAGQPEGERARAVAEQVSLAGVRRIVAVASGKGGVGKSTVAVNLALALKALGGRVGLMDADIYGPSVPLMMGTQARPRPAGDHRIHPVERYGIKLISMGFFLDDKSPVIWRGPIVMGIVRQFLREVVWTFPRVRETRFSRWLRRFRWTAASSSPRLRTWPFRTSGAASPCFSKCVSPSWAS